MSPFTGELILFDERSEKVLRAMSIALFRPALKCIHCTFNFCGDKEELLRNARAVVHLASKLSRLEEVHFDFIHVFDSIERGRASDSHWYKKTAQGNVGTGWEKDFLALFRSVLGIGCTTLTMCLQGPGWFATSTPEELVSAVGWNWGSSLVRPFSHSPVSDFIATLKSFLSHGTTIFSGLSTPPLHHNDLRVFNLHSSMLLHAQFCSWTIMVLNSSNITALSLEHHNLFPEAWAVILPHIMLPQLSSLSIDVTTMRFSDLSDFLHRHPQITHLYLGSRLPPPPSDVQMSKFALRQLVHLSATSDYLISLLAPARSPPKPKLKTVSVKIRIPHGYPFNAKAINDPLSCISHRLRRVELAFEISFGSSTGDWMLQRASLYQHPEAIVPYVSMLHIKLRTYILPWDVMKNLPEWLLHFPRLKKLTISTPSSQASQIKSLGQINFLQSIRKRSPRIETVEINQFVHDMENLQLG
jgi:hypothetical protein